MKKVWQASITAKMGKLLAGERENNFYFKYIVFVIGKGSNIIAYVIISILKVYKVNMEDENITLLQ